MGLRISIYRSDYRSTANLFDGVRHLTIVNAPGSSDPTPDAPAAVIVRGAFGDPIIVPVDVPAKVAGPMFGGSYGATSDSRFRDALIDATGRAVYGAIPIHDRVESWDDYAHMSL